MQFTQSQLAITNEILSMLPEKYKKGHDGLARNKAERPDVDYLRLIDPSESVRSCDILKAVKERLEIIKVAYTGGTILQPLLNGIASNFETDEDAETVLKLLILLERLLIENGVIPSDYIFCMASKRSQKDHRVKFRV